MIKTKAIAGLLNNRHIERFWSHVAKADNDACWPWTASRTPLRYGVFTMPNESGEWKTWRAHRVAYVISNQDPPAGLVVCHRCDNPLCCNPAHLFVAPQAENIADMRRKGRKAVGSRNGLAKLTESDIPIIRKMLADKVFQKDIAQVYGVSGTAISNIKTQTKWRHVMDTQIKATR